MYKKCLPFAYLLGLIVLLAACGYQTPSVVVVPVATATKAPPTSPVTTIAITPTAVASPTPTVEPLNIADWPVTKPLPTAKVNQAKQEWLKLIDQAEQKWKAKGIANYYVETLIENGTWEPKVIYKVTVKNGQVAQSSNNVGYKPCCQYGTPYPTLATFDTSKYTISGLFNEARSGVNGVSPELNFYIKFDPTYGFPQRIGSSDNRYTDTQVIWEVKLFQELK